MASNTSLSLGDSLDPSQIAALMKNFKGPQPAEAGCKNCGGGCPNCVLSELDSLSADKKEIITKIRSLAKEQNFDAKDALSSILGSPSGGAKPGGLAFLKNKGASAEKIEKAEKTEEGEKGEEKAEKKGLSFLKHLKEKANSNEESILKDDELDTKPKNSPFEIKSTQEKWSSSTSPVSAITPSQTINHQSTDGVRYIPRSVQVERNIENPAVNLANRNSEREFSQENPSAQANADRGIQHNPNTPQYQSVQAKAQQNIVRNEVKSQPALPASMRENNAARPKEVMHQRKTQEDRTTFVSTSPVNSAKTPVNKNVSTSNEKPIKNYSPQSERQEVPIATPQERVSQATQRAVQAQSREEWAKSSSFVPKSESFRQQSTSTTNFSPSRTPERNVRIDEKVPLTRKLSSSEVIERKVTLTESKIAPERRSLATSVQTAIDTVKKIFRIEKTEKLEKADGERRLSAVAKVREAAAHIFKAVSEKVALRSIPSLKERFSKYFNQKQTSNETLRELSREKKLFQSKDGEKSKSFKTSNNLEKGTVRKTDVDRNPSRKKILKLSKEQVIKSVTFPKTRETRIDKDKTIRPTSKMQSKDAGVRTAAFKPKTSGEKALNKDSKQSPKASPTKPNTETKKEGTRNSAPKSVLNKTESRREEVRKTTAAQKSDFKKETIRKVAPRPNLESKKEVIRKVIKEAAIPKADRVKAVRLEKRKETKQNVARKIKNVERQSTPTNRQTVRNVQNITKTKLAQKLKHIEKIERLTEKKPVQNEKALAIRERLEGRIKMLKTLLRAEIKEIDREIRAKKMAAKDENLNRNESPSLLRKKLQERLKMLKKLLRREMEDLEEEFEKMFSIESIEIQEKEESDEKELLKKNSLRSNKILKISNSRKLNAKKLIKRRIERKSKQIEIAKKLQKKRLEKERLLRTSSGLKSVKYDRKRSLRNYTYLCG